MRNVLVTGARGLLGSHLVPLLAGSCRVFALDRPGRKAAPGVTAIGADLSRPLDVAALPPRLDAVVHLAQSRRFRDFPEAAGEIFQVNTAQLVALLDHCRRVGASHFLHASTGGVYARSDEPLTEASPLAGPGALGFYAATKLAGEMLARSYAPFLTILSLRFFFLYAPNQPPPMLVPRLIASVREGRPVTLQGPEGMRTNPIHAADAAAAVAAALDVPQSAAINVAGPDILSIRAMALTIGERLGVEPLFEQADEAGPTDLIGDTTSMRRLLTAPQRRFADAVGELL
ncbi:MAG TPA: NAD(P)-dependent oxidoreductase [Allosphingosinicella sp.]|nr:NAD(P)-dependent oxidoreductase [Allosphingosinicella sp.]